jgi:hypothetical protein
MEIANGEVALRPKQRYGVQAEPIFQAGRIALWLGLGSRFVAEFGLLQ